MRIGLWATSLLIVAMIGTGNASDNPLDFCYPAPDNLANHKSMDLWGTFYHTKLAENAPDGFALIGPDNKPIGPKLGHQDWCKAALEGAASIKMPNGSHVVVNVRDADGPSQVNCDKYYPRLRARSRIGMRHTRFFKVTSPNVKFGFGVRNMPLVSFRTIAVVRRQRPIAYNTLLFVPDLRGRELVSSDGSKFTHDGYVFAANTGSSIKGNHIDFFTGFINVNPFPDLAGGSSKPFKAYWISDKDIRQQLLDLHTK